MNIHETATFVMGIVLGVKILEFLNCCCSLLLDWLLFGFYMIPLFLCFFAQGSNLKVMRYVFF